MALFDDQESIHDLEDGDDSDPNNSDLHRLVRVELEVEEDLVGEDSLGDEEIVLPVVDLDGAGVLLVEFCEGAEVLPAAGELDSMDHSGVTVF